MFPEPTARVDDPREVLLGYLDFFRDRVLAKVGSLSEADARRSTVPSGWTPIELVSHLLHMERRWVVWGFAGRDVGDPWADERDERWWIDASTPFEQLRASLLDQGSVTRAVVYAHHLTDVGAPGPRWEGTEPATLERVLLHVVQEYARHLGQLDVVVELAGGPTGE